MSLTSTVGLVICSAILVHGMELPGQCPVMPPSNWKSEFAARSNRITTLVPFTEDNASLLFPSVHTHQLLECLKLSFVQNYYDVDMSLEIYYDEGISMKLSGMIDKHKNGSFGLSGQIYEMANDWVNVECHRGLITEVFHVWVYGYIWIMWSCREDSNGVNHDEALLVSMNPLTFDKTKDTYNNSNAELYLFMNKYLHEDLLQKIYWSVVDAPQSEGCPYQVIFPCPAERDWQFRIFLLICILILIITAFIVKFAFHDNRVNVLNTVK